MVNIRFIASKKEYDVVEFNELNENVLDLTFAKKVDEAEFFGGFEVLNENNGLVMGVFDEYSTIYRKFEDDPLHFQLSKDKSVYVAPEPPVVKTEAKITFEGSEHLTPSFTELVVPIDTKLEDITYPEITSSDPEYKLSGWSRTDGKITGDITIYAYEMYEHIPTFEELKAQKRTEMDAACESTIYAGVDVTLADGSVEHFSLTEKDQLNLFGKQVQLASGAEKCEYHRDGEVCKYYSAADMAAITTAAMSYVTFHTTYVNALHVWIADCTTKEELQEIFYGALVPDKYVGEVLRDQYAYMEQFVALVAARREAQKAAMEKVKENTDEESLA